MRILVTGPGNTHGQAIVLALLQAGHHVRIFGDTEEVAHQFDGHGGTGLLHWQAGDVSVGGSIEPALSERQVLIHAAGLDTPVGTNAAQKARIEMGARYARYAAEREQVDHFILIAPAAPARGFAEAHEAAIAHAEATRGVVNHSVVRVGADPQTTAAQVLELLGNTPELGKQPGRENDAVTA